MNGTINELKQGLFKCANENWDRTYLTGQVVISSICESAKDTIEDLEKENVQLKVQIEEMKNCWNCKYYNVGETTCLKGKPHNSGGCIKDWELRK